ncbi:MAG: gluconate 2-dehydrogenase subunit 3 family protein [Acidobacteriaceae bacterium]|nr:gluconate 2-dehydrogenase subunit 3 family protein [Acidobacteriaceae bacterium]
MPTYSSDRRSLLKIIGAIGATCAYPFAGDELLGQTVPQHEHFPAPAQAGQRFFNEADFRTISRIADLIIPATDTPGATGAGVPEYIDMVIARNTEQQLLVADGLRWLDAEAGRIAPDRKFLEISEDQQLSILQPLCDAADAKSSQARNVQFFALIKGLTADGYYTSRTGLLEELGYKGNAVRSEFPACKD